MKISQYLMDNYYAHYRGKRNDVIPTHEQINQAILNHPDKIIIVRDGQINGIAWFLTLTNETYDKLEYYDLCDVNTLVMLAREKGNNIHFVLVAADSYRTIKLGLRRCIKNLKPKSVSWWSPDFTRLHRYNLR